ncbi:MAG: DUF3108 domain-containing protein [Rubrimonas sp.]
MRRLLTALCALIAIPADAARDGDALIFDLSVAGVPIGTASLRATGMGDAYALQGEADFGFLFWGGQGGAVAQGRVAGDRLTPERYRLDYQGRREPGLVEIGFDGGRAVSFEREPPIPPEYAEGRIEVTEAHLANVLDPLSAMVRLAPSNVDPQTLCSGVLPVFSGYTRFDLHLDGALSGGSEVECAVVYRPVAGHRPDSPGVRRITRPGAIRLALAPIGEGVWAPSRVTVATRVGEFAAVRR